MFTYMGIMQTTRSWVTLVKTIILMCIVYHQQHPTLLYKMSVKSQGLIRLALVSMRLTSDYHRYGVIINKIKLFMFIQERQPLVNKDVKQHASRKCEEFQPQTTECVVLISVSILNPKNIHQIIHKYIFIQV